MAMEGSSNPETGDLGLEAELVLLRSQADALRHELKSCKDELQKLQKQLSQSERLQKTTESYNEDLRQQVNRLSAEIHERKKREREKVDAESQTEEYTWTETDYYNYYYGGYYQSETETTAETQENVVTETQEVSEHTDMNPIATETVPANLEQPDGLSSVPQNEESAAEGGSIADMLRATAEEALNQTGFVFDESSGMYYDHSTGFYYDSTSQLYYDANTGMYYYYDPESGKYQFHSRIEMPTAHPEAEQTPQRKTKDWKNRKSVKNTDRASCPDGGDHKEAVPEFDRQPEVQHKGKREETSSHKKRQKSCSRSPKRTTSAERSRKTRSRDRSRDRSVNCKKNRRRRKSGSHSDDTHGRRRRRSGSHSDDARSRRRRKSGSHSDDSNSGKRKKKRERKRERNEKHRNRKSHSEHVNGESEPEEGEITESDGEKEPSLTSSSSSSSSPPVQPEHDSPEREMEIQIQEEAWPPCVRVTVVRSPVLQTGTLFILTADSVATIGREKDMNHAIRIPEMGVSKTHAEVYFDQDQQCYMLVDQGSQNGTVINGNRILQPKVRCDPCPLTHGDEVKMGETVLSFHIHAGTVTCDGCEPGQIIAHLNRHKREENTAGSVLSKEDKEIQRQKELKMMKVKYGLKNSDYEEQKALKNTRYKDRAESRRQTFGSEGSFQRDDAPASVHVEIGDENKGRQMLEKMGWKRGEGLGKDGAGMKDPIQLQIRKAQSGLGSGVAMSVEDTSLTKTKTQRNWERARERFSDACQGDSAPSEMSQSPKTWVKSQDTE